MDTAYCEDDHTTYSAPVFAKLAARELARRRRALFCPACRATAYFRAASTSGQAACFGARPHFASCEFFKAERPDNDDPRSIDDFELLNDHSTIIVDLAYGSADADSAGNAKGAEVPGGGGQRHSIATPSRSAASHRRLRTLLFNLVHAPDFGASNRRIVLEGFEQLPAREFFVRFADVGSVQVGSRRGFWGVITDASDISGLWLNYGRNEDFSVLVPGAHGSETLRRARVNDTEELSGAQVLVLGELRRSKANKLYVKAGGPEFIAIRPARI